MGDAGCCVQAAAHPPLPFCDGRPAAIAGPHGVQQREGCSAASLAAACGGDAMDQAVSLSTEFAGSHLLPQARFAHVAFV